MELAEKGEFSRLPDLFEGMHPSDIADLVASIPVEEHRIEILKALPTEVASETLAEMADRGWFWRDHIEEGDWKGMYEIATAYLTASPLYLAGSQRASTLTAAISLGPGDAGIAIAGGRQGGAD